MNFSHLRIRFFNTDRTCRQPAVEGGFTAALQPLLESGIIHRVTLDTYSRELERYGADLIGATERIFHNDSLAVLRFICVTGGRGRDYRLLFALRGIDMFLDDFSLTCEEKAILLGQMRLSFFNEFGGSPLLQKQLNERYRKYQQLIFSHMDRTLDKDNEIDDGVAIFTFRSAMNKEIVGAILSLPRATRHDLFGLLTSYTHMYMNRLFIAKQRTYELVVYHFLEKYYLSRQAIEKQEGKKPGPLILTNNNNLVLFIPADMT